MPLTTGKRDCAAVRAGRSIVTAVLSLGFVTPARPALAGDKEGCVVAHEQAQELRHASKLLDAREKLIVCSQNSCPTLVRADCGPWLGEVESALPSVVVTARDAAGVDVVDVRWFIDGVRMGELLNGEAISLDPGEHRFRFEHSPSAPVEEQLLIREREKSRRLVVQFGGPAVETAAVGKRSAAIWPYLLAGAGGVAMGSFAYFGIKGRVDADMCHGNCSPAEAEPITNELRAADISLVSGLVLTAAAAWLLLTSSPPSKPLGAGTVTRAGTTMHTFASTVRCEVSR
jgi:hypothetical protein